MTMPTKRRVQRGRAERAAKISCSESLLILQPACKLRDLEIQDVIEDVLRTNLSDVCYDSWDSESRCLLLSELIKKRLNQIEQRLRDVVVAVFISHADDSSIEKAGHRVWRPEYDSFASAWFRNESLFAVGTVFAFHG